MQHQLGLGLQASAPLSGGGGGYTTGAVAFDGATFMETSSLTATDSSQIIASGWVNIASNNIPNSPVTILYDINPAGFEAGVFLLTNGTMNGWLQSADGTHSIGWSTNGVSVWAFDSNWHSILFSASLNFPNGSKRLALYIDDAQITIPVSSETGDGFSLALSGQDVGVPDATSDYPVLYAQYAADFQFYAGASIAQADGTINTADRRNFVTAGNKPVDPATAIAAYGSPLWYFHIPHGGTPANFANNLGTGGDFTLTGTLTAAPSSPSD